jgi:hypothetical protein
MEREVGELYSESKFIFEFLDTPGDEVAPGSNEVGEDLQYQWRGHDFLLKHYGSNRSSCSRRSKGVSLKSSRFKG